eukprot:1504735-Prymnesium_polylepis.1
MRHVSPVPTLMTSTHSSHSKTRMSGSPPPLFVRGGSGLTFAWQQRLTRPRGMFVASARTLTVAKRSNCAAATAMAISRLRLRAALRSSSSACCSAE